MNTIEAKQKALEYLVQRVVNGIASEYDLNIYNKLKKLGVIK